MVTRRASTLVDDLSLRQQVEDIRHALGNLVVTVDADALLRPIAAEKRPGSLAPSTDALPTLDPPLSETIIAACRDSR